MKAWTIPRLGGILSDVSEDPGSSYMHTGSGRRQERQSALLCSRTSLYEGFLLESDSDSEGSSFWISCLSGFTS